MMISDAETCLVQTQFEHDKQYQLGDISPRTGIGQKQHLDLENHF